MMLHPIWILFLLPGLNSLLYAAEQQSQQSDSSNKPSNSTSHAAEEISVESELACLRVKLDWSQELTERRLRLLYCYMTFFGPTREDVRVFVNCLEEQGIKLTDSDMADVVELRPYDSCKEEVIAKKQGLDEGKHNYTMITNLEDDRLSNLTDSVLCTSASKKTKAGGVRLLKEDTCITNNQDPRLAKVSQKKKQGMPVEESDKNDLLDVYFEQCNDEYKLMFMNEQVDIEVDLVRFPSECRNEHNNMVRTLDNIRGISFYLKIVTFIFSAIGLISNLLGLSVFCRPSYMARYRISSYCIARCIYDILMLCFCIQRAQVIGKYRYLNLKRDSFKSAKNVLTYDSFNDTVHFVFFFVCYLPSSLGTVLLTLAMSLERLISTTIPMKAKVYLTHNVAKKVTIIVVFVTLVVALAIFIPISVITKMNMESLPFSIGNEYDTELTNTVFTSVWSGVVMILPWLIMLVSTGKTLWEIKKARQKRAQMTSPTQATNNEQNDPQKKMALIIVICFLVALVPEILNNVLSTLGVLGICQNIHHSQ